MSTAETAVGGVGAFLAGERDRVERALHGVVGRMVPRMPASLRAPAEYALLAPGKRLRPILCVAAYRAVRDSGAEVPAAVYELACALEIVHTYSLVHDDLPCMDDDDLRRGRPTVHRVHGAPRATIAGAALLPTAVEVLDDGGAALGLDLGLRSRLTRELCRAAGAEGMVGGQLLDLEGEHRETDARGLERIHRAKTGALLAASLRVGALAARADEPRVDALTRYGNAIGLAFQITDDVLDVTASSEELGKTAGRDESLHKASYPSLFGVDGAQALARQRVDEAKEALQGLVSPELHALADYVVERRK